MTGRGLLGILLTNTGSPAAATPSAVRAYLAQFLGDRRVIDLPRWFWLPLLHGVILNTRPRRSARLYRNIWSSEGSPLVVITRRLAERLEHHLEQVYHQPVLVAAGMRYGEPSIHRVLNDFATRGIERLLILPLFPQYSATTSAAMLDAVWRTLLEWRVQPEVHTVGAYYSYPAYLSALSSLMRSDWQLNGEPQRVLFSFHGIPESYALAGDPYGNQCQATAQALAERLEIPESRWQIAFQSRFGAQAWLQPYTHEVLGECGRSGLPSLQVCCPGFAVDCLETLDEIAREGRAIYETAGGNGFATCRH